MSENQGGGGERRVFEGVALHTRCPPYRMHLRQADDSGYGVEALEPILREWFGKRVRITVEVLDDGDAHAAAQQARGGGR